MAPVALVSPEKAGPSSPMMLASPTICGATWVAFCGSPSVSNCLMVNWQPGLAVLNWSRASLAPSRMLIPSAALDPVSGPAMAITEPEAHFALPSPAGSTGVVAAAAPTSCPSGVICFNGTIVNAPPAAADPDDDALPDAAVDPLAAGAADVVLELLSVAFEPQAANVRVAA